VEHVVIAYKDVPALKARLELVSQLTFDTPYIVRVKEFWGQTRDFARLIPVEETAQRHSDMTGIPVHRPPDEALDVAHQPVISGRPVPQFLARSRAFLLLFSHV
jgi:hypothetical protein